MVRDEKKSKRQNGPKNAKGGGKSEKGDYSDGGQDSDVRQSTKKRNPFEDDSKVPAGSWIQHSHEGGRMFWRNNHTGAIAHDLWYGSEMHPEYRNLVPAAFAPIFVEPKSSRKGEKGKKGKPEVESEEQPKMWFCHPWEEIYHPLTGKKHWRHRQTGEQRHKDPLR